MKTIFLVMLFYFVIWPMVKRALGGSGRIFGGGSAMDYGTFGQQASANDRLVALCTVMGMRMGAIDGSFDHSEIQALLRAVSNISYGPQTQKLVELLVNDVTRGYFSNMDEREVIKLFGLHSSDTSVRSTLLNVLRDVAQADGVVGDIERRYFMHIGTIMGLSSEQAEDLLQRGASGGSNRNRQSYSSAGGHSSSAAKHYETLGLQPGASQEEIKKRYRELAKQLHPDKVAHMGGEIEKLVSEKFITIQAAYDALKN